MADIRENVKNAWMKGMELIGNTASSIANTTKYKVDEMNLVNRRREILNDFGAQAYSLWQKGASFPAELEEQLNELKKLDEQLNDLRAERVSGIDTSAPAEKTPAEEKIPTIEIAEEEEAPTDSAEDISVEAPEAPEPDLNEETEATEEKKVPKIEIETEASFEEKVSEPLSDVINDLFGNAPSVDDMAGKVNKALDSLGDNLKKFAQGVDQGLSDLNEKLHSSSDKED